MLLVAAPAFSGEASQTWRCEMEEGVTDEQVMGVLWIGRDLPVEREDLRVLCVIADMAASALTRVTLHEETELRL